MAYKAFNQFVQKWGVFDPIDNVHIGWKKFTVWDIEKLVRDSIREHEVKKERRNFPTFRQ